MKFINKPTSGYKEWVVFIDNEIYYVYAKSKKTAIKLATALHNSR